MSLRCIDVERFRVGRFGNLRLQKGGRGVTVRLWRLRARAFWSLQADRGVEKSGLAGSCAILR
jgi:hypothetical protein